MRLVIYCFLIFLFFWPGFNLLEAQTGAATHEKVMFPSKIVYPPVTEREGKGRLLPVLPVMHPRLFLVAKDITALAMKWASPVYTGVVRKIENASENFSTGILKDTGLQNYDIAVRNAIEAKAFLYVFKKNEAYAREAISTLLHFYATLRFDPAKQDVCREIGRAIVTGALVYDWCYPLLTAAEKQELIDRMEALATTLEIKWPFMVQGSVTGHGTEAQLSRDMLSFGVAVYNEKPEIYNRVAGRLLAEFVPARNTFYPAGYHHQGSAYGPYRYAWDLWPTLIFDKLGYPNFFGTDQAKVPYYFIYSRRPDGQLFRNGDDFIELSTPFGKYWNLGNGIDGFAGSYFKDPILVSEFNKERKLGDGADYLFDLLFYNPPPKALTTKKDLPLTRYFSEPFGAMIARTGWEEGMNSAVAIAEMKLNVYNYANHQHLDAGSFQLYYKGPLAIQSGIYQGKTGGYGSEHFRNYSQRTIAHNTMLVYDPSEEFYAGRRPIVNDGGQPYRADGAEATTNAEILAHYKTGEVLAHAFGPDTISPDYSYLKGELALAYGAKVKSFERAFVFLHLKKGKVPAALVLFDKVVAADPAFKKTWLLHCVEEPVISKNVFITRRTEKGYGGQLQNTTLLPLPGNLSVKKTGGAGQEFTVNGKNYPQATVNMQNSADSAMWRIEVSPKAAAATDLFLNVMQVTDMTDKDLLPVQKIETKELVGAIIGEHIVLFGKPALPLIAAEIEITGLRKMKLLVTGLAAGTWTVKSGKGKVIKTSVTKDGHVLYIEIQPGRYQLTKNK